MYNEIRNYENNLEYNYTRNRDLVYAECLDTGAIIKVYYEKNVYPHWFCTNDNTHYEHFTQAFDAYEQSLIAAYEQDYRRNRADERGNILS